MMSELVNHLWQSTAFAILVAFLTLAFRRNRAQVRYWIWFGASVKFLVPFSLLLSLGGYFGRAHVAKTIPTPAVTYAVVQVVEPFSVETLPTPSPQANIDWIPFVLLALWVCGFVGIVVSRLRAWLRIREAMRASQPLKIDFPISVRSTPHVLEPGVVGIFRPLLLLPAGIMESLDPSQFRAILTHEECHVRRRDNLTAAIHMLVEAVFWFHSLVWWISARLTEERERACDESVLESGSDPQVYAESILNVCKVCVESPLACVSGVTGADLKRRIVRIMTQARSAKLTFSGKLLLASFALAAILGPLFLGLKVAPRLWAQNNQPGDAQRPAFEVTSVKPNPDCQNKPPTGGTFTPSPDRLERPCVNLRTLIQTAYGTFRNGVTIDPEPLHIEGGPSWVQSVFYSVSAKAAVAPAHPQMMDGPMLQVLLEQRFQLKIHYEMREAPVYAMTVGKGGLKVQPLAEGGCTPIDFVHPPPPPAKPGDLPKGCGTISIRRTGTGDVKIDYIGNTMRQFAQRLSGLAGRDVTDKTGVPGTFNFHLEFMPDPQIPGQNFPVPPRAVTAGAATSINSPPPSEPGPDLFEAVQEQIGLKLSSSKGSVKFLIIDHAEKPIAN